MIKRSAQRIHIGSIIHCLFADLLRRDIIGSTPYLVGILLHRGQTKVHKLGVTVGIQKNVLGLDVAMNKALIGGAAERLGDLLAYLHNAGNVAVRARIAHNLIERTACD